MTDKYAFTRFDYNGDTTHDGVMMACVILLEWNPETKVGVQALRDSISRENSTLFSNNFPEILEHIDSAMTKIKDLGETHITWWRTR